MIRWTTPTLNVTIPSQIECDYIILTMKQYNNVIVEKRIEAADITEGKFSVEFTQEETSKFNQNLTIEVQLNIINGDTRMATQIAYLTMNENLHDEVI